MIRIGIYIQIIGVVISVFGFLIAGKLGRENLQLILFFSGMAVSFIGFFVELAAPKIGSSNKTKVQPPKRVYLTSRDKVSEFAKRQVGISIFWVFLLFFSYYAGILQKNPSSLLGLLLITLMKVSRDYKEIYKNAG